MLRMLAYFGGSVLLTLLVLADATALVGFGWAVPVALCTLAAVALLSLPLLLWWPAGVAGWLVVAVVYLGVARTLVRRHRMSARSVESARATESAELSEVSAAGAESPPSTEPRT